MRRRTIGAAAAAAVGAALLLGAAGLPAQASGRQASSGRTLVIDNGFVLVSADPGHVFEPTGELIVESMYDTLLGFNGANFTTPVPELATSYSALDGGRKYVFHLNPKARFSDGTPVTSADVVWSLDRMVNLKGNPSFLLSNEHITAQGPETVVFTSASPNPALPYILPNPACGILNEAVVSAHGGTDAADASTKDSAENWLDDNSAGSGPYVMSSWSLTSQVVLKANPSYWGPKPAYSEVVVRNVPATVQGLDVERGSNEVALDLSPSQTTSLSGVNIVRGASPNLFFLLTNDNRKVSTISSNRDFQLAVRYGVNYKSLVQLAGSGSRQAAGVIPSNFVGALPASADAPYNPALAKSYLAKSGLGHPSIDLTYPIFTVQGVSFGDLAARVQQDLSQIGINVTLQPQSITVALQTYRAGTEAFGLWYWGPDYPDPQDYLVFAPGHLVGLRAGWFAGDDTTIAKLANKASSTVATSARQMIYQQFQREINAQGPFVPLIQTAAVVVTTRSVKNAQSNALWELDIRNLG